MSISINVVVLCVVIMNSSCQGTKKLNPRKMAVPGANFAGKGVGSKGLNKIIHSHTFQFSMHCHLCNFYINYNHTILIYRFITRRGLNWFSKSTLLVLVVNICETAMLLVSQLHDFCYI